MPTQIDFVEIRSFLMGNIETILANLAARRENNKNDSEDIFGSFDDEDVPITWAKKYDPKTKLEVLQLEKYSLGVYMQGNPLEDFEVVEQDCRKLTGLGKQLHIVIIEKVKKIFTKSQAMMFALQLTTLDGEIEGVIYSKKAMQYSPILEEDAIFLGYW